MNDCGQWTVIIDLDDYSVRMAGSSNLRYCRSIADVDAKHYPERSVLNVIRRSLTHIFGARFPNHIPGDR